MASKSPFDNVDFIRRMLGYDVPPLGVLVMEEMVNPTQFISELDYINYRHNRNISPEVSVERWRRVYGPTADEMEARYQREQNTNA